jgi:hypothetical protein
VKCSREGCPGEVPKYRQGARRCSKLCADVQIQQSRLAGIALQMERDGSDMTSINERWDALERVAHALTDYRSLLMQQHGR